jgi:hypothetical protein
MRTSKPDRFLPTIMVWTAISFFMFSGLVVARNSVPTPSSTDTTCTTALDGYEIPKEPESPFGTYPNPLQITQEERQLFHPVIVFPKHKYPIPALDLRYGKDGMSTKEDQDTARKLSQGWRRVILRPILRRVLLPEEKKGKWAIGKYDENRLGLYDTDLFLDTENKIDGYGGRRTVHLGVDLDAPAGTKVYAFCDGIVHSAGYNAELGDYGNVVVIQHELPTNTSTSTSTTLNSTTEGTASTVPRTVWALYGHLDSSSIRGKKPGTPIRKGQVIGRVGDIHENGGWIAQHVHFQLSIHPPDTHDMPGASSVEDRPRALIHYPDPRYVLGPVH